MKFKNNKLFSSSAIILSFIFSVYGKDLLNPFLEFSSNSIVISALYNYSWWIIPSFITVALLYSNKIHLHMGLNKGFTKSLIFSFISVSPMFFGAIIYGDFNYELNAFNTIKNSLGAGFMEEFLFRGFLFGLLFYKNNWGFIPASLFGAIVFGTEHLYQGNGLGHSLGIFLITGVGAVWFSWLFVEWNKHLWVPILFHSLMNLSWLLFDVSPDALGGYQANVFRAITIASSIIITILYHKKNGLIITKEKLILNRV